MFPRKPDWLKASLGGEGEFSHVKNTLRFHGLHTVCEEAKCPNKGVCWGEGTATFMILGDTCTRNCSFCAVSSGAHGKAVDPDEPMNLAEAVKKLRLRYVVITSVDRDDLPDKGAGHYAECIQAVKKTGAKVEVLIPDYTGEELRTVVAAGPDVVAHNIEIVERLQNLRDRRASYESSLETLRQAKESDSRIKTKSSIMLGLGEKDGEILAALDDLRNVDCDILVLGQYLQPTRKQTPVVEYIKPEKFKEYGKAAKANGFIKVVAEPLARTSYKAAGIG
ncbi:MAG: lipoyl synthase [Candidatus Altiarchaeota archaeon]